jgi:hypothetical protein
MSQLTSGWLLQRRNQCTYQTYIYWNTDSSVYTVTNGPDVWGVVIPFPAGAKCSGWIWGPSSVLPGSWEQSGRRVKWTTHHHMVLKLVINGAIPPLHHFFMGLPVIKCVDKFTFMTRIFCNEPHTKRTRRCQKDGGRQTQQAIGSTNIQPQKAHHRLSYRS